MVTMKMKMRESRVENKSASGEDGCYILFLHIGPLTPILAFKMLVTPGTLLSSKPPDIAYHAGGPRYACNLYERVGEPHGPRVLHTLHALAGLVNRVNWRSWRGRRGEIRVLGGSSES
jgi:hypothetical protein